MNAGKFTITVVTAMMLLTTGVSAMTMPGYGMGSTEDDAIIMTESETSGFNTYYNSAYGYALDIPAAASEAEATSKGEGCYFEDPDTHAVISVYATRNIMQLTADQLYRMDLNVNGSPALLVNEKTEKGYVISWQKKNKIFYEVMAVNDNGTYTSFSVVYPVKMKTTYEAYCAHMKDSFIPAGAVRKTK